MGFEHVDVESTGSRDGSPDLFGPVVVRFTLMCEVGDWAPRQATAQLAVLAS